MKITKIQLRNFKRFTDLVVQDIPPSAKLVVVVGPNGCGKSSLFDALLHWYRQTVGFGFNSDELYYRKGASEEFNWHNSVQVTLSPGEVPAKGCLYVRTAYRNDPDFTMGVISKPSAPSEQISVGRFIDNDQTVSANYQRLVYDTMSAVYDQSNDAKTVAVLREELIGNVRASMRAVFGDLELNNIADPLGAGAFFFSKGTAASYHYKNLSGGEKAAFDLLLDLHTKKKFFPDAIYCVDELETHLHTRVQGRLLREMFSVIPGRSQLWVTTHSLGVLRAAQELALEAPNSVCVVDFDSVDPDVPREIVPSSLGRVAWEKMMSIALDDLSTRIAPKTLVICEGSNVGNRRKDFDAEIYNRILGSVNPDILFVSGGASNQLAATGTSTRASFVRIFPSARVVALCDRDDKSSREVADFEAAGDLVLPERNLESVLFGDDVIEALVKAEGKPELLTDALLIKANALQNSTARGNASDDLKSAAGEIYVGLKRLLALQRCGNSTDTFMRDTLAPIVVSPMPSYELLRTGIVDRIS